MKPRPTRHPYPTLTAATGGPGAAATTAAGAAAAAPSAFAGTGWPAAAFAYSMQPFTQNKAH